MSRVLPPREETDFFDPLPPPPARSRRGLIVAIVVLVALVAALVIVLVTDDDDEAATPATSSSSTTTTPTPSFDAALVVFPDATTDSSYANPTDLTRDFAMALGFDSPIVGELRATGAHEGEVDVRPTSDGPATTVLVRQRAPVDDWWVTGATTNNIRVSEPAVLATITSPVSLRGESTAFEANVNVSVRQDGSTAPIGEGFVMGGSNGDMGPFSGTLPFGTPSAEHGVVVFATYSMADGSLWEATVVRVRFGATTECGGLPAPDEPADDEMTVTVFYTCGGAADGATMPVTRTVPRTTGTLRASLDALLAGPTEAEQEAGLESWFSAATAGMVESVDLDADGSATVDFGDLRTVIPNASASAGSQLLLSQLDATVFAHPSVTSVIYRIDGSCEDFNEWLQFGGCEPRERPEVDR